MTRGKNGPDIEFGDPSSRTTDQSGDKGNDQLLTKNPHPILQRVGEVGWAVLSSWADMVLVLFGRGIGVLALKKMWSSLEFSGATCDTPPETATPGFFSALSDEARPGRLMQKDRLVRLKMRERERERERESELCS